MTFVVEIHAFSNDYNIKLIFNNHDKFMDLRHHINHAVMSVIRDLLKLQY